MKILLPYKEPENRKIDDPIVTGGIEYFCKLVYEHFDVEVYQIPYLACSTWDMRRKREKSKDIIKKANEIGADIIINNFSHGIYCGSEMSKSHIPIMNILHSMDNYLSIISRLNNLSHNNHSIFFVSEWQKNRYLEMAKRAKQKLCEVTDYINSSYCKVKIPVSDNEYECGTIGRCNREKKPFLLKEMLKDTDIKNLVITNKPFLNSDDDSVWEKAHNNYYEKGKTYDNVLWNLPHKEVMTNISKCGTYFSTWNNETYGITALESLSCGVPLILNGYKDNTHASEIIPASQNHYKVIPKNDKDALIDAIKSFKNIDKKEIQEMTWEKHNEESWKKHFANCMDKTVEKFNKKTSNLNEFMV